ncbi:MAG: 5-(carboxyamino)imidazole ribonucleotide synthase, partial [Planctomycetota bacterium]
MTNEVTVAMQPIYPPATLGMLGGGQLGRMFAIAAAQMGYH